MPTAPRRIPTDNHSKRPESFTAHSPQPALAFSWRLIPQLGPHYTNLPKRSNPRIIAHEGLAGEPQGSVDCSGSVRELPSNGFEEEKQVASYSLIMYISLD